MSARSATRLLTILAVSAALLTTVVSAGAAGPIRGTVWVANEHGDSLSVIDASTNHVITTLTGIAMPHNVQVAPDGHSVWTTSHGGHDAGHAGHVVVIDARTYELRGHVMVGTSPAHVIVTPNGRTAYVSNSGDNTVTAIDTKSLDVKATIPVGEFPHGLRPSPNGREVYVANMMDGTVSVISTKTNEEVATIPVGAMPVQVGFDPHGRYAYVSLNGENAVAKIDVRSREVVDRVDVGVGPIQIYATPKGDLLLVANQGTAASPSDTLSVIDTETFERIADVRTGNGVHGVVVDSKGDRAYVTNLYDSTVGVVDLESLSLVATVPVGMEPNGISFTRHAPAEPSAAEIPLPLPDMGDGDDGDHGGMDGHAP